MKGGAIASLAPEGTEAPYKVTDGVLEVELMGKTHSGTWDGAKLVIEGAEAVKQP